MSGSNGRVDSSSQRDYRKWRSLVEWMESKGFDGFGLKVEPRHREGAGRGLFSTMKIKAVNSPILSVPATALLNARTLKEIYPEIPLEGFHANKGGFLVNGTVMISLHLSLHRANPESSDPHFGPYINCVPSDFEDHPLTWLVRERRKQASQRERRLLSVLPPSVFEELCGVAERFGNDCTTASECLRNYGHQFRQAGSEVDVEDFLWAWLVVNTRCVFYRIFEGHFPLSNLTLCPIIEFANHTESNLVPRVEVQKHSEAFFDRDGLAIEVSDDLVFLSPDRIVEKDEEIYLKYGDHSKSLLFTEYGFVDDSAEPEVDVTWLIMELIKRKPSAEVIKKAMSDVPEHFQSKMQFFVSPEPPAPTWTTMCTLRLINLKFPSGNADESLSVEEVMKPWYDVSLGIQDQVSHTNEMAVREDIKWMTKVLIRRASEAKRALQAMHNEGGDVPEWHEHAVDSIQKLWEEQSHVASLIRLSLAADVQF